MTVVCWYVVVFCCLFICLFSSLFFSSFLGVGVGGGGDTAKEHIQALSIPSLVIKWMVDFVTALLVMIMKFKV